MADTIRETLAKLSAGLPTGIAPSERLLNQPNVPKPAHFAIRIAPLSLEEVYGLADNPANGAVVVMSGMVRNNTEGNAVVALEYQAYEPMALQVFQQVAADIQTQWSDVTSVVIHHRVGRLCVGEISVLVAVGCPHRSEAFAACKYAIDTLKHNAPIWKKNIGQMVLPVGSALALVNSRMQIANAIALIFAGQQCFN